MGDQNADKVFKSPRNLIKQQNDWLCEIEDDNKCEEKEILNIFK